MEFEEFKKEYDLRRMKKTKDRFDSLTRAEMIDVLFTPHVITCVIDNYLSRIIDYCRKRKIAEFVPVTREAVEFRKAWVIEAQKGGSKIYFEKVMREARSLMMMLSNDFGTLRYTVKNELLKRFPDDKYIDMRTDAQLGLILARYYYRHEVRVTEMLDKHDICEKSNKYEVILNVSSILRKYTINTELEFTEQFEEWLKAFNNWLYNDVELETDELFFYYDNGQRENIS